MKKRPGSIGSSPRRDGAVAAPASAEDAVNKVLVTMHSKLKELETKYTTLVSQCQGMLQETRSKSREVTASDVSFFDESQSLQYLRAIDEDREKVESELNYILKAKKTLTMDAGSKEDESVKQIYADLSEVLRVAQTQILKMLQGMDWTVRSRASDVFTGLSDAVWTQVSLLRSRTESREMKELLNEVMRLEQSKQVLDLQSEEYQETLRQKFKTRHHRDKRRIAALQAENKRLEGALQEAISAKSAMRSSSSSLNVSLKPAPRQSAIYRSARSSISPSAKKRFSDYTEEMSEAEKELLFHSLINDTSAIPKKVRTSAAQTQLQDIDSVDLEIRYRLLASASKKYALRTQKMVKRANDAASEEALQSLFQALSSISVDDSTDFERSSVCTLRDKQVLEQTNSMLEKENARLDSKLQEVQEQYSHLYESLEKIQRSKPELAEQNKRLSMESHVLTAKVRELEQQLDNEMKANKKLKKSHKAALEDLIKDCTELTNEVKLLSEEKGQLLSSYEKKGRECDQERFKAAALLRDTKQVISVLIANMESIQMEKLKEIDSHSVALKMKLERDVPLRLSAQLRRMAKKNESEDTLADLRRDNETLKNAIEGMSNTYERLVAELKSQLATSGTELRRANTQLSDIRADRDGAVRRTGELQQVITQLTEEKSNLSRQIEDLTQERESKELMESLIESLEEEKLEVIVEENVGSATDGAESQLQELEGRLQEEQERNKSLEAELEVAKTGTKAAVDALETERKAFSAREESLRLELKSSTEKADTAARKAAALERTQEELTNEIAASQQQINRLVSEKATLGSECKSQIQQAEARQREVSAEGKKQVAELEAQIRRKDRESDSLRQQLESLKLDQNRFTEEIAGLEKEAIALAAKSRENKQLQSEILRLKSELQEFTTSEESLKRESRALSSELEAERTKLEATQKQLEITTEEYEFVREEMEKSAKSWQTEREMLRSEMRNLAVQIEETESSNQSLGEIQKHSEERTKILEEKVRIFEEKAKNAEEKAKSCMEALRISEGKGKRAEEAAKAEEEKARVSESACKSAEERAQSCEVKIRQADIKTKSAEDRASSAEARLKISEERVRNSEEKAALFEGKSRDLENKARVLEERNRTFEEKIKELEAFCQAQGATLAGKVAEIKSLRESLTAAERQITVLVVESEKGKALIRGLQDDLQQLEGKQEKSEAELQERRKELDSLQQWIRQVAEFVGSPEQAGEKVPQLQSVIKRERTLMLRLPLWASEVDVHISDENFDRSIESFTEALGRLAREKRSLERNLNSILENTAQVSDSSSELRLEVEKLHMRNEKLTSTVDDQKQRIEVLQKQVDSAERALEEERNSGLSRIEGIEKQYESRLHEKTRTLTNELSEQENQCAALKSDLGRLQKELAEARILTEDLQTQLAAKLTEVETLTEALKTREGVQRPQSPEFDFAEEAAGMEAIAPVTPRDHEDDSFRAQVKGFVKLSPNPGTIVKTVCYEDLVWNLVYNEENRFVWVAKRDDSDSNSEDDMEERLRKMECELIKKQQVIAKITDTVRPHTQKPIGDIVQALESVLASKSPRPKGQLIPKLAVGGLKERKEGSDGLLDTPRVLSSRTPREPSSSMERQFQAIEKGVRAYEREAIAEEMNSFEQGRGMLNCEPGSFGLSQSSLDAIPAPSHRRSSGLRQNEVTKLQQEIKERDKRLGEDAQQIIVLQTENNRLKAEMQDYENTVLRLEEQLKLKNEELHRLLVIRRSESDISLPILRNSLLRLIAELPVLQREAEDMVRTLFSLLGMTQHQIELTEQARRASKAKKGSLLAQLTG